MRTMYKFKIFITLKEGILDPEGQAVQASLKALSFDEVQKVKMGKYIELDVEAADEQTARRRVEEMCAKLLANPVIEQYHFELAEAQS